jgi:hypothetical protein
LRRHHEPYECIGTAYVDFEDHQSAKRAIQRLNGMKVWGIFECSLCRSPTRSKKQTSKVQTWDQIEMKDYMQSLA